MLQESEQTKTAITFESFTTEKDAHGIVTRKLSLKENVDQSAKFWRVRGSSSLARKFRNSSSRSLARVKIVARSPDYISFIYFNFLYFAELS